MIRISNTELLPLSRAQHCISVGEGRRHFRHGSSSKILTQLLKRFTPMNTYLYLLGYNWCTFPSHPHPSVENIAIQLTWNWSVFFLLSLRGLFCNINVVTCLQNKGATLLYNLYFYSICHHVRCSPAVLLHSPDGAWPAPANFWLPLFLFHTHPLLSVRNWGLSIHIQLDAQMLEYSKMQPVLTC